MGGGMKAPLPHHRGRRHRAMIVPFQTVPPVFCSLLTASWIVNAPLACNSAVTLADQRPLVVSWRP
jgi:hypothetical protein